MFGVKVIKEKPQIIINLWLRESIALKLHN
nr:MAG TPA: hypothetical protein [Caudoviricetes sp.]